MSEIEQLTVHAGAMGVLASAVAGVDADGLAGVAGAALAAQDDESGRVALVGELALLAARELIRSRGREGAAVFVDALGVETARVLRASMDG